MDATTTITDDTGLAANRGKRGGWTVEVPTPTPKEIAEGCARVRASWSDPLLRLELGLSEVRQITEEG